RCISVSGLSIDAAIAKEVLRVLKPLGIEAAVKAIEAQSSETTAAQRQLELALQQARYETAHARRQYDAVDPDNRLVAGELERRWNEALQVVHRIEGELAALEARKPPSLGEWERMSSKCWHQHCARATSSSWTICALTRSRGCGKRSKPPEQRCAICLSALQ